MQETSQIRAHILYIWGWAHMYVVGEYDWCHYVLKLYESSCIFMYECVNVLANKFARCRNENENIGREQCFILSLLS